MQLSKKEKIMIFVLIIVMLVGGFYKFGYEPIKAELDANLEKLGDASSPKEGSARYELKAVEQEYKEANASSNSNYVADGEKGYGISGVSADIEYLQGIKATYSSESAVDDGYGTLSESLFWAETDENFGSNYLTLNYMLTTYLPANGIDIDDGTVAITTYTQNGVTKLATVSISNYVCSGGKASLYDFINEINSQKSLKLSALTIAPTETEYPNDSISGSMTLNVQIATN